MTSFRRVAVVMAGGAGERFWPLSRRLRPKQLLRLAHPELTLLEQTFERLVPMFGAESVFLATAPHLVEASAPFLGDVPPANVLAEPHKRNTSGCLVWAAANLLAADPEAEKTVSMAVLAADHRIEPDEGFRETIDAALTVAEETGGLATIGIPPTRPETGYGYIEVEEGAPALGTASVPVRRVKQFREKPNADDARAFVQSGRFLWNSGTFFWRLDAFLTELSLAQPELELAVREIAALLSEGKGPEAAARFEQLPNLSIDYALMEKARQVYVAQAAFDWDDVGAWDALDRSLPGDDDANVVQGEAILLDATGNVVVNETEGATVCLLGVDDLTVVVTEDAILIAPKSRAQEVRKAAEAVRAMHPHKA